MTRPRLLLGFLICLLCCMAPTGEAIAAKKARRTLSAVVAPLRLVPQKAGTITVPGLHSYLGSLELKSASNGLVVVDRLSLEKYLLGLDEVPPEWPTEALRAQAVAARTYTLWTLAQPRGGTAATYGFDICASTDCQVFSGAEVVQSLLGERWRDAVRDTAGRAVLFTGEPILARYHSTSGGHTFDNEEVFTSEGSYPYLQGVPSRTEQHSPLYRWKAVFPVKRAEAILRRAGLWSDQGRLQKARSNGGRSLRRRAATGPQLIFSGSKGRLVLRTEEFRDVARDLAPELYPNAYPSQAGTSTGRLPETLPSDHVSVITRRKRIVFLGRGWGHGVGMSQWGAEGMARRGASYRDILTHYYTNTDVGRYEEDRKVSVGVAWGRPDVTVEGAFSIVDGRGRTVVTDALGTWKFIDSGSGSISVRPPAGFGLPLEVGIVEAPKRVESGATFSIRAALSRPARVRVLVPGSPVGPPGVYDRGVVALSARAPHAPGSYEVTLQASSGKATSKDATVIKVEISGSDASQPTDGPDNPSLLQILTGIILIAGTLALPFIIRAVTVTMKR